MDIKYTLPKLQSPPTRNTPQSIRHSVSSFSLAAPRSPVLLYIMSRTLPREKGTAIVTLEDTMRKLIAPESKKY